MRSARATAFEARLPPHSPRHPGFRRHAFLALALTAGPLGAGLLLQAARLAGSTLMPEAGGMALLTFVILAFVVLAPVAEELVQAASDMNQLDG